MSKTTNKFSPEVRERAVRLVLDNEGQHGSRWQAIMSIAAKIGCAPQTLNDWVKKAEVNSGKRRGVSSEMAERMKALERENRELRQANEILRKGEPVKAPLVQAHWRTRILRWPLSANARIRLSGNGSSTAGRSDGQVHSLPGSACLHAREGMTIAVRMGSNRFARHCRSPLPPIMTISPSAPIRRDCRIVPSAMKRFAPRSSGFSMRTGRSMACARSGGSCDGKAST